MKSKWNQSQKQIYLEVTNTLKKATYNKVNQKDSIEDTSYIPTKDATDAVSTLCCDTVFVGSTVEGLEGDAPPYVNAQYLSVRVMFLY